MECQPHNGIPVQYWSISLIKGYRGAVGYQPHNGVPAPKWGASPTMGYWDYIESLAPQRGTRGAVRCQPYNGVPGVQLGASPTMGYLSSIGVSAPQRDTRGAAGYQPHNGVPAPPCGPNHSPVPAAGEDQFPLFHEHPRSWRRLSSFRSVFGTVWWESSPRHHVPRPRQAGACI